MKRFYYGEIEFSHTVMQADFRTDRYALVAGFNVFGHQSDFEIKMPVDFT